MPARFPPVGNVYNPGTPIQRLVRYPYGAVSRIGKRRRKLDEDSVQLLPGSPDQVVKASRSLA